MRQHQTARHLVGSAFGIYVPQQLVSATELGALFVAQGTNPGTSYLLRVLSLPAGVPAPTISSALQVFQHEALRIGQLQHPYILPLIDAGVLGEVPYLVWPLSAMRPLSSQIEQGVPLDLFTIGRYLDQIAAALEYAHQSGILHGNLSPDCIYIQRDGRLTVADLGVRRLIELLRHDMQWHYLYSADDACAPEQILGRAPTSATDVYALGAVLYQMLAGQPVFAGATREDVAHAHLHEPVPPISALRGNMPLGLDELLAAALAKEPAQRIRRPGELANAYHDLVAPGDTNRVPFVTSPPSRADPRGSRSLPMTRPLADGAAHSQPFGMYPPPTPSRTGAPQPTTSRTGGPQPTPSWTGAPRPTPSRTGAPVPPYGTGNGGHPQMPEPSPRPTHPPSPGEPLLPPRRNTDSQPVSPRYQAVVSQPIAPGRFYTTSGSPLPTTTGPTPPLRMTMPPLPSSRTRGRAPLSMRMVVVALVLVLVLVLLAVGGALALHSLGGPPAAAGQVVFSDSPLDPAGSSDTLSITLSGLGAPSGGSHYAAWLVNQHSEQVFALGALVAQGKTYTLGFRALPAGDTTSNLLALGNTIEITSESTILPAPAGNVVLSGSFPPDAFVHIGHLLIAYPTTPGHTALLVGALRQTDVVAEQAQALAAASTSQNLVAVDCYAQNIVNVLEGTSGLDYRSLASRCGGLKIAPVGDGFGLLSAAGGAHYLDAAAEHASLAATQPDATASIRQHAQLLEVAITTTETWLREAQHDALTLLKAPSDAPVAQELLALCDKAYHGVDTNGDGHVDPVQGEGGMVTAYAEGQQMATLSLTAHR
ncbi:MAG: protein kinase [Ktedonobacterales bacterium]